jgi:excisionase family DNA binding protein
VSPHNADDDLLTPCEVAEMLGASAVTVGRWARTGVLKPSARTPGGQRRYRRADVDARVDEDDEQLAQDAVRLYAQGWSIRRVAEEFGTGYGRMRRILLKHTVLRKH